MKKKFIYVSLFMTFSAFTMSSCGSSSEPEEDLTDQTEMVDEDAADEADKFDVTSFTSADEAMEEYKSMLEKYADLTKSGRIEEAWVTFEQMQWLPLSLRLVVQTPSLK